jgi:polyisoprenoid-binding protein YceI
MKFHFVAVLTLAFAASAMAAPRAPIAARSEIAFTAKQMGVSVDGHFTRFDATIDLDPAKPESGHAEVSVDVASLTTGDDDADGTARDKPWLDAAAFPKATFKSSAVRALGPGRYEVKGTLTLRGKPRDITVPFASANEADGGTVVSGAFSLNRSDFGIGGGEWNEGDVVANAVQVRFRLTLPAH